LLPEDVQHHSQLFWTCSLGYADPNPFGQEDLDVVSAAGSEGLLYFDKPAGSAVFQLMLPVLKRVPGYAVLLAIGNLSGSTGSPRFQMSLPLFPEGCSPGGVALS
jgi:hypothetical protein